MVVSFLRMNAVGEEDALGAFLERLAGRDNPDRNLTDTVDGTQNIVAAILADVKKRGLDALVDYTRRFDAPAFSGKKFSIPVGALAEASAKLAAEDKAILLEAAANIRAFHENQKEQSWFQPRSDGSIFGQMVCPVERAGLYVPGGQGGSTPLLSSLLMNAVPAQVAGVDDIAVITPPCRDGSVNPYILATAYLLGIREVYAAGSAWGVAALAYGAEPLRPVDVIAGPGNIYVTTAKRLLIGVVGIDMLAGPSEICIVADQTANPVWTAADMLAQAEHDSLASSVCICTDEGVARAVLGELERQCASLPRREIVMESLRAYGAVILAPDMDAAMTLANRLAPEHLELLVAEPWLLLPRVRHAGAVFLGACSAEAFGDYYAGPNHVLPTMGTARFSSALSVSTFCKKTSVLAVSRDCAAAGAKPIARLARLEGLEAHARSALCRGATTEPF